MKLAKLDKLIFLALLIKSTVMTEKREEETGKFRDPCYKVSRSKGKGHVTISRLGVQQMIGGGIQRRK